MGVVLPAWDGDPEWTAALTSRDVCLVRLNSLPDPLAGTDFPIPIHLKVALDVSLTHVVVTAPVVRRVRDDFRSRMARERNLNFIHRQPPAPVALGTDEHHVFRRVCPFVRQCAPCKAVAVGRRTFTSPANEAGGPVALRLILSSVEPRVS